MWRTKRTTLNFNGSFYEQIDGVGMGSPIALAFADIFMNYVIEKIKKFNVQPDVFFRYVDDCFAVFLDFERAMLFYRKLNQIHNNIKFTYELENKQLPFLDVNVDTIQKKNRGYLFTENQNTPSSITSGAVWLPLTTK